MSTNEKLYRVEASHFVAAFTLRDDGVIIHCAPIINYFRKMSFNSIKTYCEKRGWKLEEI